jgi:hypothetical protein
MGLRVRVSATGTERKMLVEAQPYGRTKRWKSGLNHAMQDSSPGFITTP